MSLWADMGSRLYFQPLAPARFAHLPGIPGPRLGAPAAGDRILVLRLDEIGDLVLTGPLLEALRRALPQAWVTLLVKPACLSLARACPFVDEALAFDLAAAPPLGLLKLRRRMRKFALAELWPRRFSLALAPRFEADGGASALLAWMSGAPRRAGWSTSARRSAPQEQEKTDSLFSELWAADCSAHAVEHAAFAARALGWSLGRPGLRSWARPEHRAWARQKLQPLQGRRILALVPGAGQARKVWPVERYAQVAHRLEAQPGLAWVILGGVADQGAGQALARVLRAPCLDLVGQADLPQSQAVLELCSLYLGNDTGPMHMAAAAQVPVVAPLCHPAQGAAASIYSPQRFGPWGVPSRLLQPGQATAPCRDECLAPGPHCILGVSVDAVAQAAAALLGFSPLQG
jgi:heptosyltransferase-2